MPRKPLIVNPLVPYNIGARSNNKDWFLIPIDCVWEIMETHLYLTKHFFLIDIHSFVLMNNHFHLIASFPKGNLSEAMQYFMRETSRTIAFESKRINHVYGGRHYRSEIEDFHSFENIYKYNYRNPVEAGLCANVEDYKYSTLSGVLGANKLNIPVCEDTLVFNGSIEEHLRWLNKAPKKGFKEDMRRALKRTRFRLPRGCDGKSHPLNIEKY